MSDLKTGVPFESASVEMSNKNKVIKSIYHSHVNQIIHKGKPIKIIEVWSENSWCYKDTDRNIEKFKDVNFIIRFDKEIEEITSLNGKRLGDKNTGLGITNYRLFTELTNSEQTKDTLIFLFKSDKGTIPIKFTKTE
jgi:hypothetical protein